MAQSDGHDLPGLFDNFVPCIARLANEIVVEVEDAVLEPGVTHELKEFLSQDAPG
jgi:hypothetical protein